MRLGELALKVGGVRDSTITMAVKRLHQDASKVKDIRRAMKAIAAESKNEDASQSLLSTRADAA